MFHRSSFSPKSFKPASWRFDREEAAAGLASVYGSGLGAHDDVDADLVREHWDAIDAIQRQRDARQSIPTVEGGAPSQEAGQQLTRGGYQEVVAATPTPGAEVLRLPTVDHDSKPLPRIDGIDFDDDETEALLVILSQAIQ